MKKKHYIIFSVVLILGVLFLYNVCIKYEAENITLIEIYEQDNEVVLKLDSSYSGTGFISCKVDEEYGDYSLQIKTSIIGAKSWPQEVKITSQLDLINEIKVVNPRTHQSKVIYSK